MVYHCEGLKPLQLYLSLFIIKWFASSILGRLTTILLVMQYLYEYARKKDGLSRLTTLYLQFWKLELGKKWKLNISSVTLVFQELTEVIEPKKLGNQPFLKYIQETILSHLKFRLTVKWYYIAMITHAL